LSFHADGYREAEHSTPKIDVQKDFEDIVVKMKKKPGAMNAKPMGARGRVTRNGKPVEKGWVALGILSGGAMNMPNADVMRNRTTASPMYVVDEAAIDKGEYSLKAYRPGSRYVVIVYEPGHAPTVVSGLTIDEDAISNVDIDCVEGGTLEGKVTHHPDALKGQLWAVAFSRTGYRVDARVQKDGTFRFADLPPGEYGVKIGHDGIEDRDVHVAWPGEGKGKDYKPTQEEYEAFQKAFDAPADPWKRAKLATVKAKETTKIDVELPEEVK
jgi:hypothetical protein